MGLLKHFRSKSRLKDSSPEPRNYYAQSPPSYSRVGADRTQRLPDRILENIFSYVCPHTQDHTYESCEESQIGDGCMLCDLRDLSACAQTCRKWYTKAQQLLYTSIRIDAVHYCELEDILAERRRKGGKHFRSKSAIEPVDVPNIRLSLLCRTVREQPRLAKQAWFLKLPYMARETAKGDLARTVAVLPNLRYVDLPDGFYTGDPSCLALRQELQANCPDIRKMTYRSGSEDALEMLVNRHWLAIERLELIDLSVEPATLRIVLSSLPTLHELTLSNMHWIDDSIFKPAPGQLPDFPPIQALKLKEMPNLTVDGLSSWLQAPHIKEMLFSLTLENTGVTVQELHTVLRDATNLQHMSIQEIVSKSLSLSATQLPVLSSHSLHTLHYEIANSEDVHGLQKPAESYYAYLATSLHSNALPELIVLYVRDQNFPELLMYPPAPSFGGGRSNTSSLRSKLSNLSIGSAPLLSGGGFHQTLEVFSKGIDELEWVFTSITPTTGSIPDKRSSTFAGGRPVSLYNASRGLGPQWAHGGFGGDARKSVIVGNGFGGFLAVPQDEVPRPLTAEDGRRGSRWGSIGSGVTGRTDGSGATGRTNGSDDSWLKPPPSLSDNSSKHERRGSRHDLWR